MEKINPFALIKASDISYEQINSLWVSIGDAAIDEIIEPRSRVSKFVLGGKGTGKTHILRYFSYPALSLRHPEQSGVSVLTKNRFLAVFLRANGLDSSRFESPVDAQEKWQAAFAFYFEIRLVEAALEVLALVRNSSPGEKFHDEKFLEQLKIHITDPTALGCETFDEFRKWIASERRKVDQAVNNAAFSGALEIVVPFSLGDLSLNIGGSLGSWHSGFSNLPFIYLLDEIENFSDAQQQVVNTLIRYGEGRATFRVGGRLYAIKTQATLSSGEENREGAEFKTVLLDKILLNHRRYPEFAKEFISKRLLDTGVDLNRLPSGDGFDPKRLFLEVESSSYFSNFIDSFCDARAPLPFERSLQELLKSISRPARLTGQDVEIIARTLTEGFPVLLKKLNILLFAKKARGNGNSKDIAASIAKDARSFMSGDRGHPYNNAYGHYSIDLLAQLCRELKRPGGVPYAGFENFTKMSSGNPRNLLVLLGKIYSISAFKEEWFFDGKPVTIEVQTAAASDAAKFMFEQDTNFGTASDLAREAVSKLATLLRAARYAQNIPEVSPLAVSFEENMLSAEARATLRYALHFSFLFEIDDGRPDRNSKAVNKKVQLNPMLSPRWGLPLGRRGDIKLGRDLLNAIFEHGREEEFNFLLKSLEMRWNNPFSRKGNSAPQQEELFPHD